MKNLRWLLAGSTAKLGDHCLSAFTSSDHDEWGSPGCLFHTPIPFSANLYSRLGHFLNIVQGLKSIFLTGWSDTVSEMALPCSEPSNTSPAGPKSPPLSFWPFNLAGPSLSLQASRRPISVQIHLFLHLWVHKRPFHHPDLKTSSIFPEYCPKLACMPVSLAALANTVANAISLESCLCTSTWSHLCLFKPFLICVTAKLDSWNHNQYIHTSYFKHLFLYISSLSRTLQISKHCHFTTLKHLLLPKDKDNYPGGRGGGGSRPSSDPGRTSHSPQQEKQNSKLPVLPKGPPTLGQPFHTSGCDTLWWGPSS